MVKDGEKYVYSRKKILLISGIIIIALVAIQIYYSREMDNSTLRRSTTSFKKSFKDEESNQHQNKRHRSIRPQVANKKRKKRYSSTNLKARRRNIKYSATQVIHSKASKSEGKGIPTGTKIIGKLISSVDTRDIDTKVQIIVKRSINHHGNFIIPKNTILNATAIYKGGEKVFLKINQAILPSGNEVKIAAQALDPKTFTAGLHGEYHDNKLGKIGATLGLTMVSAMTDTLQEKEAFGNGAIITPKANLKNALYNGVSTVTEMEAQRQAQTINSEKPYVTVKSGSAVIVNLTKKFKGELFEQ